MEKIVRWWAIFLTELESGKRVTLFYSAIVIVMGIIIVKQWQRNDKINGEKFAIEQQKSTIEKDYNKQLAIKNDSCAAQKDRIQREYNAKTEGIYQSIFEDAKRVKQNIITIQKKNEKIISNNK